MFLKATDGFRVPGFAARLARVPGKWTGKQVFGLATSFLVLVIGQAFSLKD